MRVLRVGEHSVLVRHRGERPFVVSPAKAPSRSGVCLCLPNSARFDPASLEILRQLSLISGTQEELLQIAHSLSASQPKALSASPFAPGSDLTHAHVHRPQTNPGWDTNAGSVHSTPQFSYIPLDKFPTQPESASTTPAASAAAARWFDLLANDTQEAFEESSAPLKLDGAFLNPSGSDSQDENGLTPLQRATRIVDDQQPSPNPADAAISPSGPLSSLEKEEESMWKAPAHILLLHREQVLFENFLRRICSWVCSSSYHSRRIEFGRNC